MFKNSEQYINELKRIYEKSFGEKIKNEILESQIDVIENYTLIWSHRGQKYKLENYFKKYKNELIELYHYSNKKEIENYLTKLRMIIKKVKESEERIGFM